MFNLASNATCNNAMFSGATITTMHPTTERLYLAASKLKKVVGQSAVASLIGESPQTVKNWESRGISAKGAINASLVIGCRSEWLLHDIGPITSRQLNWGGDRVSIAIREHASSITSGLITFADMNFLKKSKLNQMKDIASEASKL
jgi:hypothetical protein